MNEVPEFRHERAVYRGVAIGAATLCLAALYAVYAAIGAEVSLPLVVAMALVAVDMGLFAASSHLWYRHGRGADTARLDRTGRVLTWMVVVLVVQQLWAIRHR